MNTRSLFLGFAMLGCMASTFAQVGGTTGPLTWKLENETLTISGKGEMPDYSLDYRPWCQKIYDSPSTFTISCPFHTVIIENDVTSIGSRAFLSASNMESISIPNSVTKIGSTSFEFSSLKSIIIPNGVTNIEYAAFSRSDLTTITLPRSVTNIGGGAFYRCNLVSITNLNPVPLAIDPSVFAEVNINSCTLYVPFLSVPAYKNAPVWREFNIVGTNVGIEDMEEGKREVFKIYPNPTTGTCSITIPEDFLQESSLTLFIYDSSGKLLQQISIDNEAENFNLKLEYKAKGVYPVVLSNGKKSYNGKIVFE